MYTVTEQEEVARREHFRHCNPVRVYRAGYNIVVGLTPGAAEELPVLLPHNSHLVREAHG